MKKEKVKDFDYINRLKARRKRGFTKKILTNLLLFIPPLLCLSLIVLTALTTYSLSLFLIYFILPMFYTVDKRLRYDLTGIGKPDFSYADGYKAFFSSSKGGIFGVISSIFMAIAIALIFFLILSSVLDPLVNCFPEAKNTVDRINEMLSSQTTNYDTIIEYVASNIYNLTSPLTIFVGLVMFVPTFYVVFFAINTNLSNHYIASVVLPDIDKNISASQARNLARTTFSRLINLDKLKENFRSNWPYYLLFAAIYGLTIYGFTYVRTDNQYVMTIIFFATPTISIFTGFFLNYFCLINEYSYIEENQKLIFDRMPNNMRQMVHDTYCNPNYIHGEESAARGCFIPEDSYRPYRFNAFNDPFGTNPSQPQNQDNPYYTGKPSNSSDMNRETAPKENSGNQSDSETDETPVGVVIDLSDNKEQEKDDKADSTSQGKDA